MRVSPDRAGDSDGGAFVDHHAAPVSDEVCLLGESPRWDAIRHELVWTDLLNGLVFRARWDGESLHTVTRTRHDDLAALCIPLESGAWLFAGRNTVSRLRDDGRTEHVAVLPIPKSHRMNDGAVDRGGRLVVGTMHDSALEGQGVLWSVVADAEPRQLIAGATIPNGLCWSLDGADLLWVDSSPGTLAVIPYDHGTGQVTAPRKRWHVGDGDALPDGMAIDSEGMLWIALWDGSRVIHFDPESGGTTEVVHIPTRRPTACALGGPDLDVLFITTATHGLDDEDADTSRGRVHAVKVDVPGVAVVASPPTVSSWPPRHPRQRDT